MFLSPKSIRQSVAVSFMALAASQAGAEMPADAKGHADWLPISGPVEDKVCPNRKKPGDWMAAFDEAFAKQDIVFVTTNNCKQRFMKIAPSSGKLLSVLSNNEVMGSQPAKVVNAVPAPENWWLRGDLVPSKPQGEPSISRTGVGKWMCDIKFGNSQTLQAAPGALVIPDATRAFYVSTRRDPSIQSERINGTTTVNYGPEGKEVCTIDPVIIMPTEQNVASSGVGKWGSIGAIGKTPSPNVEPAAAAAAEFAVVSMLALPFFQFTIMKTQEWLRDHPAVVANNTVVIPKGGDLIATTVEMSGLSAVEMGQLIGHARELPSKGDVEAAIKRNDPALATPLSETMSPPGTCKQDEYNLLTGDKDRACANISKCTNGQTMTETYLTAIKLMSCALKREEQENKCFDGGNRGHRIARENLWNAVKNCLNY